MTAAIQGKIHKLLAFAISLVLAALLPVSGDLLPVPGTLLPGIHPAAAAYGDALLSGGPAVQAQAAIVMEVHSGAVLYGKNTTEKNNPLSLTKLMTCLLALENGTLTDSVTCSYTSIHGIGKQVTRVGLVYEERLPLKDMLYAMMVASADEASYAIGEYVGGGKISAFITMMNNRAAKLGCVNSGFVNAYGAVNEQQYSCAYDLALIASELSRFPDFYRMAGAKWYELPATNKNGTRVIAQTHAFIRQTKKYDYATAGKSGGSIDGSYALCTYAEKNGMQLVAIVLGCPDNDSAYDDTVSILNYGFENYQVYDLKKAEGQMSDTYTALFGSCPMFSYGSGELVYINDNASLVMPNGGDISKVTKTVEYYDVAEYVHGENIIGSVLYQYEGQQVGKSQIIFNNPEFPISQEEFDALWPKFLIPPSSLPSQGGSSGQIQEKPDGTDNKKPAADSLSDEEKKQQQALEARNRWARWLSLGVFGVLFLASLFVIYITIPAKLRKRRRRRALH